MPAKRALAAATAAAFGLVFLSPPPPDWALLIGGVALGIIVFLAAWNGELK
jgi:hypothetical protein